MSDKCEWKDGLLTCCDAFHKEITRSFQSENYWNDMYRRGYIKKCPHCGVRIDGPEPEVIIRKSGGTLVARYDGIDYLRILNINDFSIEDMECQFVDEVNNSFQTSSWVKISEIEITDEIAKSRPMVIDVESPQIGLEKLYAVEDEEAFTSYGSHQALCDYRLATVSDLEDDHA